MEEAGDETTEACFWQMNEVITSRFLKCYGVSEGEEVVKIKWEEVVQIFVSEDKALNSLNFMNLIIFDLLSMYTSSELVLKGSLNS